MKRIIKTLTLLLAVVFTFTACNKNVIAEVHPESAIENTATAAGNAVAENNSSSTAELPAVNNAVPENQTNNAPAQGTENANNQVAAVTNNENIVPVDSVEDADGAVLASAYGTVAEHVAAGRIKNNHGQYQKYFNRYGEKAFWMYQYNKKIWKDAKKN